MHFRIFFLILLLAYCQPDGFSIVDLHNDRSFFITAQQISFADCSRTQICLHNYADSKYFFTLWRPELPIYARSPWQLTKSQAARLNRLTHFEYLQQALTDLKATGIRVSNDPKNILTRKATIFWGIEGSFLLRHHASPKKWHSYAPELEFMLNWAESEKISYLGLSWSAKSIFIGNQNEATVGLSKRGRYLVKQLVKRAILIDLSHSSRAGVKDVHSMTQGQYPLFFSHAGVGAFCDHPRNLTDEQLRLVQQSGGLVGVIYYPSYLTCSKNATIHDVVRHIKYIRDNFGIDHVGLGSDFDSFINLPEGLASLEDVPTLFLLLKKQGFTEAEIRKIGFENMYRVMKRVRHLREMKLLDE